MEGCEKENDEIEGDKGMGLEGKDIGEEEEEEEVS